jgi:glycosyltransferase involved in cell wall biosynthesis
MKVVHWNAHFFPFLGGKESYIDIIVQYMPGYEFEIVTNRALGTKRMEKYRPNATIKRFRPYDRILHRKDWFPVQVRPYYDAFTNTLRTFLEYKYFQKMDFDLLHIHNIPFTPFELIGKISISSIDNMHSLIHNLSGIGKPIILSNHGIPSFKNEWFKKYDAKFINQVRNIINVDRAVHTYYMEVLDIQGKNMSFIPNPIDTKLFSPIKKEKTQKLKVGFAGRLAENEKGGENFLFELLKRIPENIDFYLALAIDPQKAVSLQAQFNRNNVHFMTNIRYERMPSFYAGLDVLINPIESTYCVSRVTLESMACGVPVIMLPGDRYPLEHGKTGFIVNKDYNDTLMLLNEINAGKHDLKKLGGNSREIINSEYSCETLMPKIKAAYQKAIEDN